MAVLASVLISIGFLVLVSGHGLMQDPPQRSTLWRYYPEMNFERNYNDNELFCGGFSVQWDQNDGKCGTCGDAYDGAREHEAGGKYATGFISRRYKQGQDVEVTIKLTANHLGFFEFKLCPWNDIGTPVTQECLDRNILHLAGQPGVTRYDPGSLTGFHHVKLALPADVTCTQCVLQWHYKAGNNNNCDKVTGECCKGCGAQETFVNCADIAIDADSVPTTQVPATTHTPAPAITTQTPAPTTANPTTQSPTTPQPTTKSPTTPQPTTQSPTTPQPTTAKPTTQSQTTTPQPTEDLGTHVTSCAADEIIDCVGVGVYSGLSYEFWCNTYCGQGSAACSPALCHCSCKRRITCYGIGDFETLPGIDKWCTDTCQYGCQKLEDMCGCN